MRIVTLISISILLIIFDHLGLLQIVKSPVGGLIIPLKSGVYQSKLFVQNFSQAVISYRELSSLLEIKTKLIKENTELRLKSDQLTEENKKLRSQLEAPLPSSYHFIPAQVLTVLRYMEIGVGEGNGVKTGMSVVDGISLVGKVVSVEKSRSKVMLLNDGDLSVVAVTSRGTTGLVSGQYGQTVLMDKILQKDPVFLEDEVTTNGTDDFPPNLLIGKIIHINSDDVSVYKKAKIDPLVDYKTLKTVFIISKQ